jgi:hypothetical protein
VYEYSASAASGLHEHLDRLAVPLVLALERGGCSTAPACWRVSELAAGLANSRSTVSPSNVVPMKCPEARGVRDVHDEAVEGVVALEHVVDRELAAREVEPRHCPTEALHVIGNAVPWGGEGS